MNTTTTSVKNTKRNPNISKWNILFEREGKQWMSVKPQEGTEVYTCYACRELFSSKSSFLDHVNRFTMVLSFICDNCSAEEEIQFYNPCALLLHSRGHYTPFGGQIDLDNIRVSCLPFGLVGFPPHPNIPMYYNVREEPANGANLNTRFYAPTRVAKGRNIVTMVPTILLFYHYKLNGTPPASLVLKQICINVPKCVFVRLETNTVSTNNIVTTSMVKKIPNQENERDNNEQIETVVDEERCENNRSESSADVVNEKEAETIQNNNSKEIAKDTTNENEKDLPEQVTVKEEIEDSDSSKETTPTPAETIETTNDPADESQPLGKTEESEEASICPECKVQIPPNKLLSSHFTNTGPLNDAYCCQICKYVAATSCSLLSHKRLHSRRPPFICPECGKDFEDNMSLLDHLEDVCFHLAKQVRLRCPKKNCCKVFAQLATFTTHFEVHIQTLNKCTMCDATYYAVRDFVEHGHTVHSQVVPVELIYKCTICKNSALEAENYKEHVNWHCVDKTLRVYVFICKFCRNFFRSGVTYATHLMRCSKKELTIEELRRLKKCNTAVVCLHCNYVIRLVTKLPDCPRCGTFISNSNVISLLTEKSVTPAVESNNNNNSSSSSSNNNNNTNNNNTNNSSNSISRIIKCILCYEDLILAKAQAHNCKYKHPQVVLTRDDDNIKKILGIKREIDDFIPKTESNSKKKRRKSSTSPSLLKHRKPHDAELRLDEPVPFEGTYTCKICEYKDDDRGSFHEHIKEHRNVSTSYQCMECGECFVVKPSFHKHLMYYHKISNVDNYVKENECVDQCAISELQKYMRIQLGEINDDVAENQCKVCLKQFEDSLELNKHFRIHGMAFLRNNK